MKMSGQPGGIVHYGIQNTGSIHDAGESAENKKKQSPDQVSKQVATGIEVRQFTEKSKQSAGAAFSSRILQRCGQCKCRDETGQGNTESQQSLEHLNAA